MDLLVPKSNLIPNIDGYLAAAAINPYASAIMGLRNKDVLNSSPGPDTFFSFKYEYTQNYIFQLALGSFDGEATANDILVVTSGGVQVCLDYNDGTGNCDGGLSPFKNIPGDPDSPVPMPWHAVVYDHDGDGDSDAAVIGFGGSTGYLALFKSNAANAADPLDTPPVVQITPGIPLSIASGKFDGDTKIDVVVSQMPAPVGPAIFSFFKNTGAAFAAPVSPSAPFALSNCLAPTGTTSYNSDGNLVVTCALKPSAAFEPGSVYLIKNDGAANFSIQQELDAVTHGFKAPYSTAVGDLNGDASKPDLAIADFAGSAIVTFAGSDANHVDPATRTTLSVAKYNPKFLQIADMNADTKNDVVVVAGAITVFPLQSRVGTAATVETQYTNALITRAPHGILVLLNYHPDIRIDIPTECNKGTVKVYCNPSPTKTIAECKLESTVGGWVPSSTTPLVDEGSGVKSFTFTVPNTTGIYKGTIKAVEAGPGGNTYTKDFEFDYKICTLTSCPQANIPPVSMYWDDEGEVCVPSGISAAAVAEGKQFVWTQTEPAAPSIFSGFSGGIMAQLATPTANGTCFRGRFNPYEAGGQLRKAMTVRGTYAVKDVPGTCGIWELAYMEPVAQGDSGGGIKCSLSAGGLSPANPIFSLLSLIGLPVGTLLISRVSRRRIS